MAPPPPNSCLLFLFVFHLFHFCFMIIIFIADLFIMNVSLWLSRYWQSNSWIMIDSISMWVFTGLRVWVRHFCFVGIWLIYYYYCCSLSIYLPLSLSLSLSVCVCVCVCGSWDRVTMSVICLLWRHTFVAISARFRARKTQFDLIIYSFIYLLIRLFTIFISFFTFIFTASGRIIEIMLPLFYFLLLKLKFRLSVAS